jgi:predicted metal-dependent hydrolase
MDATPAYDPRYLAGIVLFNRGDFFEAHEVWESLWMEAHGPERLFFQGLIQAAVGLCHFCNGNVRGAVKLYHSSRGYMRRVGSPYLGLDQDQFWEAMQQCFAELLAIDDPPRGLPIREELIPEIALVPPPETWPDPNDYVEHEP